MSPAVWDTSTLVPLFVQQKPSIAARSLLKKHQIVAKWATSVEMRSALERLSKMGELTAAEHAAAGLRLDRLRRGWRELQPSEPLRSQAGNLLAQFPLKAGDDLELALHWSGGRARRRDASSSVAMRNFWKPRAIWVSDQCGILRITPSESRLTKLLAY